MINLDITYESIKEIQDDKNFPNYDIIDLKLNERRIEISSELSDIKFDFDLHLGKFISVVNSRIDKYGTDQFDLLVFKGVHFKNINSFNTHPFNFNLEFSECTLGNLNQVNYSCKNKVSFQNCKMNKLKIDNVKFEKLFEIYDSVIENTSIFNKTDFKDNVVFTKSTFKSNLLFTYSTFEKLGIFSRARFEKCGLDLSQSIINGNLTFFETKLKNYDSEKIDSTSQEYDDAITENGIIPIQNKRETFRIIKHQLEQQNNLIEAEKYAKLEKLTLFDEYYENKPKYKKIIDFFISKSNKGKSKESKDPNFMILLFNRISNNFKTDYRNGIRFTLKSLLIFTTLTFLSCFEFWERICLNCSLEYTTINYTVKQFFVNLNPTHSFDYIDKLNPILGLPYLFDFAGRIFIGYGIYQTIQAFRKFK